MFLFVIFDPNLVESAEAVAWARAAARRIATTLRPCSPCSRPHQSEMEAENGRQTGFRGFPSEEVEKLLSISYLFVRSFSL